MGKIPDAIDRKQLNLMLPILGARQNPASSSVPVNDAAVRQRLMRDLENAGLRKP
jgi:hypothetical protein